MTPETITERLHKRAEYKLDEWLRLQLEPIFEAAKNERYPEQVVTPQDGVLIRPWIGKHYTTFAAVAKACLLQKWQAKEVSDFMRQVDSMADSLEQLRNEIPY